MRPVRLHTRFPMQLTLKSLTLAPIFALLWLGCSTPPKAEAEVAPERSPYEQARYERSKIKMRALAWEDHPQAQGWMADRNYQAVEYPLSRFWTMKAATNGDAEGMSIMRRFIGSGTPSAYLVGGEVSSAPMGRSADAELEAAKAEYQRRWADDYPRSDFTKAHAMLLPLAESGNAAAQTAMGQIYMEGKSPFKKDAEQALLWFRKAADQENPAALATLGAMYLEGFKVEKDTERSIGYFKDAKRTGYPYADFFLDKVSGEVEAQERAAREKERSRINSDKYYGAIALYDAGDHAGAYALWKSTTSHRKSRMRVLQCQLEGKGTEQAFGPAIRELYADRDNGKRDAMQLLGLTYEMGFGTDIDLDLAKEEYERAMKRSYSMKAQAGLDRVMNKQLANAVAEQPDYEESARGLRLAYGNHHHARAFLLCRLSAGRYDVEANYVKGLLYSYHYGPWGRDEEEGLKFFGLASDQYHEEAMMVHANILLERNDTTIQAAKLIYNAAIRGNTEACYQWGLMRLEGHRTSIVNPDAVEFLTRAADEGHVRAMAKLGDIFHTGLKGNSVDSRAMQLIGELDKDPNYVAQSDYTAKQWWKKAAAKGHGNSAYILGLMREEVSDFEQAVDLYKVAVEQSHREARYHLAMIYRYQAGFPESEDGEAVKLFELASEQGHELATSEIAVPEVVEPQNPNGNYTQGNRNNNLGYGQPGNQIPWKSNYTPYSGPKPWTQEYQQRRIMRDPSLGFTNRYSY